MYLFEGLAAVEARLVHAVSAATGFDAVPLVGGEPRRDSAECRRVSHMCIHIC